MPRPTVVIDGNEAAASVAHRLSDVISIYPITPSSDMGEHADAWSARGRRNIWGTIPRVVEMQSEGGASGTMHGAVQTGALASTFTASQGLLLMIPNMYKIAGELTPAVIHVAARTVATHALSIFGDHSDVMATRATGFVLLASGSVQEAMDLAAVAHAATLESRIPFLHFFDGFRTSHEVAKIEMLADDDLRSMIDDRFVREQRRRALNPEHPVLRGSAQNPDVFFQAREAINPFYLKCPRIVQDVFDRLARIVGRSYHLFDYVGAPDAEHVLIMMGSGAEAAHETVNHLVATGRKVGLIKVRLFRPFVGDALIRALPESVRSLAILDRTKEPGAAGEPLYQDVVTALMEHHAGGEQRFAAMPRVIGGRYGLSSKEFTPAMVKAVFDELDKPDPKNHFTVGIIDDVTHTSLPVDASFTTEDPDSVRAMFFGLGSDGTVGSNKNSAKIIGQETDLHAQGYFVYDSKKAGSITVSHVRFGERPIQSSYLIHSANFIASHHVSILDRLDVLEKAAEGSTFLLNTPAPASEAWPTLPRDMQQTIIDRHMRFFVIDASKVATDAGLGRRISTVMQTCFFAISGVLPKEQAIEKIKEAIKKTFSHKGQKVVEQNYAAVDGTLANLFEVEIPGEAMSGHVRPDPVPAEAPPFVREVTARMIAGKGDLLPVSALPVDGTFETDTARWEKRNIATEIPIWDAEICIQCNKCALVCPHAAIRAKVYAPEALEGAPDSFQSVEGRGGEFKGLRYTLQVAPEDCTGCGLCVEICPAKNKRETRFKAINMKPQPAERDRERVNYDYFLSLPEFDRTALKANTVKGSQFMLPLFEYSGACVGCGETPYVKLMSQLFGDRLLVANATGCSSIYGGNLPTTPWAKNRDGRGPAWSNSLFEDNAEFGLGFRLAVDEQARFARQLLDRLRPQIGDDLVRELLDADQTDEAGIMAQRRHVDQLLEKLSGLDDVGALDLKAVADTLIRRSVWIVGGDGWAYDIGYGGLDHVLASGQDVNVLVLDTEVYSNTGGQMSKATPCGAVAKFAAAGKPALKKDLGAMAMDYGNVYVATVAFGSNDNQTAKAFFEAESYRGPSIILAYSPCIAHGMNMRKGLEHQQAAVDSGHWPLYRYDPRRLDRGENPLQLDSRDPKIPFKTYALMENRFRMLINAQPERADMLMLRAQQAIGRRYQRLKTLASAPVAEPDGGESPPPKTDADKVPAHH